MQIARKYYETTLDVEVVGSYELTDGVREVLLRLNFDNAAYCDEHRTVARSEVTSYDVLNRPAVMTHDVTNCPEIMSHAAATADDDDDDDEDDATISSDVFLEAFSFHVLLDGDLMVRNVGSGLMAVLPSVVGRHVTEAFRICRPTVELTLDNVGLVRFL